MIAPQKLQFQYRLWTLLFTLLITVGTWSAYQKDLLRGVDDFFYDCSQYLQPCRPLSGQVALVLMDEQSALDLNREKGHWSRDHIAQALNHLCDAGAEIIGLDMILSAPDPNLRADAALTDAIDRCNNVVLARISSAQGVAEVRPLERFQNAAIGDGFIDLPLDGDEVLRKIRFLNAKPQPDGTLELLPSFALELARSYLGIDYQFDFSGDDFFVLGSTSNKQLKLAYPELLINFGGTYRLFPQLSFVDAVTNRFPPEAVKGKIVILGSSLVAEKDFFTTPVTRFSRPVQATAAKFKAVISDVLAQKDLGVACHAQAIETILNGTCIQKAPSWGIAALVVLSALCGLFFYSTRVGLVFEGTVLLFALVGLFVMAFTFFVKAHLWVEIAAPASAIVAQFWAGLTLQKSFQKKRTAFITTVFGKYVSPAVVKNLVKGDLSLSMEGQHKELSILFTDLRNFTSISEKLGAQETGRLLNDYFDRMIPLIFEHEGTLDKLMGDAIMAFFGAPLEVPMHPVRAAETALAMLESLDRWQAETTAEKVFPLRVGIGINTGDVTVGNLGSRDFMDYTIIGDAVNLASRLEGLNKVYGTRILLGEKTATTLDERFLLRELDLVRVKGKEVPERIYELMGWRSSAEPSLLNMVAAFSAGLAGFRRQQWSEARGYFGQVRNLFPEDGPAGLYLERIDRFQQQPPPPEWAGITTFTEK